MRHALAGAEGGVGGGGRWRDFVVGGGLAEGAGDGQGVRVGVDAVPAVGVGAGMGGGGPGAEEPARPRRSTASGAQRSVTNPAPGLILLARSAVPAAAAGEGADRPEGGAAW